MVRVSRTIEIDATPEAVWEFIEDPDKELQWRGPEVVELERLGEGPIQAGTRYRGKLKIMGVTDRYTNELTEYNPPQRTAWNYVDSTGLMAGDGYYELTRTHEGRTRFEITLEYHPMNFIGWLSQPLIPLLVGPVLQRFAERLKELSEEQ